MPVATREAMLAGVRGNERVIAGAYVDDRGGVCPMLAAHRRGARTDFISFARTWDRFTRAGRDSRPATERELRILVTQLEDSLCEAGGLGLDEAIKRAPRAARPQAARARHAHSPPMRPRSAPLDARRSSKSADPSARSAPGACAFRGRATQRTGCRARAARDAGAGRLARLTERAASRRRYSESPGLMNMISGTTHAGEVRSR